MSTIFLTEAVNLFCGDDSPDSGKFLTLSEMKLPDLTETYAEHKPGGGMVGVDLSVGVEKLESTFKLTGHDPAMLSLFGLGSKGVRNYTAYSAVRDKRTGNAIEVKAIMAGRLGKVAPDAFQRGEAQGHEYGIMGIQHYEYHFDGAEKVYWDLFTNEWRIDGVDQMSDLNAILRIGGAG